MARIVEMSFWFLRNCSFLLMSEEGMHTILTLQLTYYDLQYIYSHLISECNETACLVFLIVNTFKIKLNNVGCIKKNLTFTIPNGKKYLAYGPIHTTVSPSSSRAWYTGHTVAPTNSFWLRLTAFLHVTQCMSFCCELISTS